MSSKNRHLFFILLSLSVKLIFRHLFYHFTDKKGDILPHNKFYHRKWDWRECISNFGGLRRYYWSRWRRRTRRICRKIKFYDFDFVFFFFFAVRAVFYKNLGSSRKVKRHKTTSPHEVMTVPQCSPYAQLNPRINFFARKNLQYFHN